MLLDFTQIEHLNDFNILNITAAWPSWSYMKMILDDNDCSEAFVGEKCYFFLLFSVQPLFIFGIVLSCCQQMDTLRIF